MPLSRSSKREERAAGTMGGLRRRDDLRSAVTRSLTDLGRHSLSRQCTDLDLMSQEKGVTSVTPVLHSLRSRVGSTLRGCNAASVA